MQLVVIRDDGMGVAVRRWVVTALVCLGFSGAAGATIIVSEWGLYTRASDSGADSDEVLINLVSNPYVDTVNATTVGGSESITSYDFDIQGSSGQFGIEFSAYRTGSLGANVTSADIRFQVSENSIFSFSGESSTDSLVRMQLFAAVRDLTVSGGPSGYVYQSEQQCGEYAPCDRLAIGGSGGDYNLLVGSLPGQLVPNHQYLMQFQINIRGFEGGDSSVNTLGFANFNIEPGEITPPPVPAPEPTTTTLLALGLLGAAFARRRRYHQQQGDCDATTHSMEC